MYCKDCNSFFVEGRDFLELFKKKHSYFCLKCKEKYQLNIENIVVPLENGYRLIVISLFKNTIKKNIIPYLFSVYSKVYEKIVNLGFIIVEDYFSFNNLKLYEKIAVINARDIILLVYNFFDF